MARRFFTTPTAPGLAPIGTLIPYAGSGDPSEGAWLLADGRLVDRTVYAAFFALVGHAYNGGVDPGSNMVRLPDRRGRASVGADNMGTAQGAANRIPNSNRTRGQSGGAEQHTLSTAEMPSHTHVVATMIGATGSNVASSNSDAPLNAINGSYRTVGFEAAQAKGGSGAHNNLQPYEIDNWLVRVL